MKTAEKSNSLVSLQSQLKNTLLKESTNIVPASGFPTAEEAKATLVKRLSADYDGVDTHLVHQAINEAHALASLTVAPLLLLPALAEEKVQKLAAWCARQRSVLDAHADAVPA